MSAAFATALLLGGCIPTSDLDDYLWPDELGTTPIEDMGSFEDARTRLDAMADEMAAAMTEAFPDCPPMMRDGTADQISGGGTIEDGATPYDMYSQDRRMDCSVSNTRERADRAIDIITTIADDYDFEPRIVFNDRILPDGKGSVTFEGWNVDGDQYSFGSSLRTVLGYHANKRWAAVQLAAVKAGEEPPYIRRETLETPSVTQPTEPEPTP